MGFGKNKTRKAYIMNALDLDNNRILIAMSGGIDSSVAAFLMKEQGYECAGATMQLFDDSDDLFIEDARSVAHLLQIPHYVVDFKDSFDKKVLQHFAESYVKGYTPNPCVVCNKFIKFGKMLQSAEELGYDYVVTGHYANVEYDDITGRYLLKKAADIKKDQSYVLNSLTQKQLSYIKFPLGNLTKQEVRKIAEEQGFINAHKKESQDICFVRDGDYAGFIEKYTGKTFPEGNFVDTSGKILGKHKGIIRYTVGQRRGLGLALPEPMYVCDKDVENNTVLLCKEQGLYTKELTAHDINLIPFDRINHKIKIKAKVRYNQTEQPAVVEQTGDDSFHIEFESPQRAVTKGQAVVLYDGDVVVGGGTIG
jgi:tRNA-specific 2-thiouridylase